MLILLFLIELSTTILLWSFLETYALLWVLHLKTIKIIIHVQFILSNQLLVQGKNKYKININKIRQKNTYMVMQKKDSKNGRITEIKFSYHYEEQVQLTPNSISLLKSSLFNHICWQTTVRSLDKLNCMLVLLYSQLSMKNNGILNHILD